MSIKTIWHAFILAIGSVFHNVVDALEKSYAQLPQPVKDSLESGSGIVELINQSLSMEVDQLRQLIIQKFPQYDETVLENTLFQIAKDIGVVNPNTTNLNTLLSQIVDKIKAAMAEGTTWAKISHAASVAASLAFAPKGTKVGTIVMFIEWVYQTLIKKRN